MQTLKKIRDIVCPYLETYSEEEIEKQKKNREEWGNVTSITEKIKHIKEDEHAKIFFEIAKSLYEEEKKRCSTVENKSAILLSALGLIVTFIVGFLSQISDNCFGNYKFIGSIIIFLTFFYLIAAIIYILRALSVQKYHGIDVSDIIDDKLSDKKIYYKKMGVLYCANRVQNYKVINEKVDFLGLAQDFFMRGIIMASLTGLFYIISIKNNVVSIMPQVLILSFWSLIFILFIDIILSIYEWKKKRDV